MSEENDALTEAENQFFESGGEVEPESIAETPEEHHEEVEAEKPAEVEESAEEPEEKSKDEKTVPYGALHEERMRRKEAAEEAAQMRERMARMEERFQQILQTQQSDEPEIVPFDEDPAEHLRQKAELLERQQAEMAEQSRTTAEQAEYQRQQQAFVSQYKAQAAQYAQTNENFAPAYQHLLKSRVDEYKAAGHTDAEAYEFVQQDEIAIAQKAFQDGVNPAERIYALAELRGFRPEAKQDATETIDRIERGQQASKSLSNGRGKAEPPLTLEVLAELDDDEFDAKWDELIATKKSVLG